MQTVNGEYDNALTELCRQKFNERFLDKLGSTVFESLITGFVAVVAGTLLFRFHPLAGAILWGVAVCGLLYLFSQRIAEIVKTFTSWRTSPDLPHIDGNLKVLARITVRSVLGAFTLNILITLILSLLFFQTVPALGHSLLTIASGLILGTLYITVAFMLWRNVEKELARHDFSLPSEDLSSDEK